MRKYQVIEDRQGGSFGTGRVYTAMEWLDGALEWADSDGNEELQRLLYHYKEKLALDPSLEQQVIELIDCTWDITLAEVKPINIKYQDKKVLVPVHIK